MIPLSIPNLSEKEAEAVAKVVREGWVSTAGPEVQLFEKALAEYCGSRFAIATNSGTAALHLSLLAAGVKPDDYVIVPNLTFVATANAVQYCAAEPILVDISANDWNLDDGLLENWLKAECEMRGGICVRKSDGRAIRALIFVHTLGYVGNLDKISALTEAWNIQLIEDAAAAMGSFQEGKHAGTTGIFGCLSFNGNKIMTTGGGGAILTDDPIKAEYLRHLSTQARRHYAEYIHDETGFNYRMTNMSAALGLAQLARMPEFLDKKAQIDGYYRYMLADSGAKFHPQTASNHWLMCILTPEARHLEDYLEMMGIEARKMWLPLSRLPMFSHCTLISPENIAFQVYEASLCLPSSTGISDIDLEVVAETVKAYLKPEA